VARTIAVLENNGGADDSLQAVFDAISGLEDDQIPGALEELLPTLAGAGVDIVPTIATAMSNIVDMASGLGGRPAGDQTRTDKFVWMKPFALNVEQDTTGGVPGYDANIGGMVLGADDQISAATRAGWMLGYAQTSMDGNDGFNGQSLDIDTYQLGLYARKELEGDAYVSGKFQFGWNNNESERRIMTAGTAKADYDSWYTLLNATIGKDYEAGRELMLSPELSINYVHIDQEGYTEHGSLAPLKVDGVSEDSLIFSVGTKLNFRIEETTSVTAHIEVGYETLADGTDLQSTFVGGAGSSFTTNGADQNGAVVTTGIGLNLMEGEQLNISINYDATIRNDYTDQGVSATLRYKW